MNRQTHPQEGKYQLYLGWEIWSTRVASSASFLADILLVEVNPCHGQSTFSPSCHGNKRRKSTVEIIEPETAPEQPKHGVKGSNSLRTINWFPQLQNGHWFGHSPATCFLIKEQIRAYFCATYSPKTVKCLVQFHFLSIQNTYSWTLQTTC